ncbi:MAG: type II secretion system F family protein [Syntrophaceae bacterium]|nr:type II secretion system F family protein [Syntrophaceae bacterium]
MATLLGAGLPLVPALTTIILQVTSPQLKKVLLRITEDVKEGNSLVQSLTPYPHIFPVFYINMIRAGESSGTLHIILERLADFTERQQALKTKIRAALAYPILMSIIGTLVLFFMMTFIVPNITNIFNEMHQKLPGITVFLIIVSGFLKTYWWIIILGGIAYFIILKSYTRSDKGEQLWHKAKLKAPLFGPLHLKISIARFSRTLGTLLQSGVPLLSAIEISRNVIDNRVIAEVLKKAGRDVEEGQPLSAPLSRCNIFPPMAVEMIAVGEQSGTMEEMLFKIADSGEREIEANITTMTSLLEPVMILFMGLVVGFIVVSILLPLFEMNQLVR